MGFPALEQHQPQDLFGSIGREGFMAQRVHRRLHLHAQALDDQGLLELGQLNFNDQFRILGVEATPELAPEEHTMLNLFGSLGREGYMKQRVHRKLHQHAQALDDQSLFDLGRLNFNEQFPTLGIDTVPPERGSVLEQGQSSIARAAPPPRLAVSRPSPQAQSPQGDLFGGIGRDAYMKNRVHRRLHSRCVSLSDEELWELGRKNFNDQFPALGADDSSGAPAQQLLMSRPPRWTLPSPQRPPLHSPNLFGGVGRDAYMHQRVHRKLHVHCAALSDDQLFALGKLNFNDQFPSLGVDGLEAGEQAQAFVPRLVLFGGLTREAYMRQRVHRKLHSHAAALSDEQLADLGKRSFNEQFPALGQDNGAAQASSEKPADLFGGMSREEFVRNRVHRRLHMEVTFFGDEELAELGKLSFVEQFSKCGMDPFQAPADGDEDADEGGDGIGLL